MPHEGAVLQIDSLGAVICDDGEILLHATGVELLVEQSRQLVIEAFKGRIASGPASPPAIRLEPLMPKSVGLVMMPPFLYQLMEKCGTDGGAMEKDPVIERCGSFSLGRPKRN